MAQVIGILTKGFTCYCPLHTVTVPKNTGVLKDEDPEPTPLGTAEKKLLFHGCPVRLLKAPSTT